MVSTLCHSRQQAEEHMDLQVTDRPLDLPSLSELQMHLSFEKVGLLILLEHVGTSG
ncbi:hypothetical protein ACP70R_021991 [Stipagrostis hirtigluma subsp. patula]